MFNFIFLQWLLFYINRQIIYFVACILQNDIYNFHAGDSLVFQSVSPREKSKIKKKLRKNKNKNPFREPVSHRDHPILSSLERPKSEIRRLDLYDKTIF